jgi:catechol 2,3-dioxygenase-like lactoylglutathione lyase family enzyme
MSKIREMVEDGFADPKTSGSIVKPYALTHGTLECYKLNKSRRFYEEFLGLECSQHGQRSMGVRSGFKFHIIAVQVGDELKPVGYLNHWGLDVATREEVDAAHAAALAHKEKYGIHSVTDRVEQHGVYSFYIEDLDHNWWEIQHYAEGYQHTDIFEFGDVFDSSLKD